jgi:hypothetical protein
MLERQAAEDLAPDRPVLRFDLGPFDRTSMGEAPGARFVSEGVAIVGEHAEAVPEPVDPLESSSPVGVVVATLAVLALLGAAGYGWATLALGRGLSSIALAPAFGVAALVLAGVAADRLGIRLGGFVTSSLLATITGLSGYLLPSVARLRMRMRKDPGSATGAG